MSNSNAVSTVDVVIGDGVASFRRRGITEVVVANILGVDRNAHGQLQTVWLDRLVHRRGESFDGWSATGAISTVLTRSRLSPAVVDPATSQ